MNSRIDCTLYLCTDRRLLSTASMEDAVRAAVEGGCTAVQVREKTLSARLFYEQAVRLKDVTARLGVPLLINDRVDVALAADADGVHVGQSDLPAGTVRRMIGPQKLLGVSVSTPQQALAARQAGADYLGVGAMYPTGTKEDAKLVTMAGLQAIRAAVDIPVIVIGGINETTIPAFAGTGIDGIAVVSAVLGQADARAAAAMLKGQLQRCGIGMHTGNS